jgi:hypothetical protein
VLKTLSDTVSLSSCKRTKVGQGEEWSRIVNAAQEDRTKLREILRGKRLFSALYGVYSPTLASPKAVLQNSVGRETETSQTNRPPSTEGSAGNTDGFQERKRKRRNIIGEKSPPEPQPTTFVPTRNFFTPLNSVVVETEARMEDEGRNEVQHALLRI